MADKPTNQDAGAGAGATSTTGATAGTPTLHHLESSQSLRVLWALEELSESRGLKFDLKTYARVKARAPPELKTIHPLGKSPTLTVTHVPGRTGEVVIAESRLILQFLSDAYADGLWTPATLADKVQDEYLQEVANSSIGPVVALLVVFGLMGSQTPWLVRPLMGAIGSGASSQIKKELDGPFKLLEEALGGGKQWFAGDKLGLADFNLSWPMDCLEQRGALDAKKYPRLREWLDRVHARPAYKRARERTPHYDLNNFGL